MSSMNPPVLARCIAPQMQLWSASEGMILDMIDLKMDAVTQAIEEFGNDARTRQPRPDLVLFMDAPDVIVVCNASYFGSNALPVTKKSKTTIGPLLQDAINAAVRSYRTPPTVLYDLDEPNNQMDPVDKRAGYIRVLAALVEDQPGNKGATSFKEWRENLAGDIHE